MSTPIVFCVAAPFSDNLLFDTCLNLPLVVTVCCCNFDCYMYFVTYTSSITHSVIVKPSYCTHIV